MLVEHGYGVLLFDRRGEGASEGDPNIFGWAGDRDLHAAAEYLQGRPDVDPDRIGGIGFSVGGEMLLQAAARLGRVQGGRLRGRERPLDPGRIANVGRRRGDRGDSGGAISPATAVFTSTLPPPSLKTEVAEDRADGQSSSSTASRPGRQREEAEPEFLRRRRRAEAALGGARRPAHRRDHGRAGRVRAPRCRLLRPNAPRQQKENSHDAPSSPHGPGARVADVDAGRRRRVGDHPPLRRGRDRRRRPPRRLGRGRAASSPPSWGRRARASRR